LSRPFSELMRLFRLSVRGAFFLKTDLSVCALTHIEHSLSLEVHHSLQVALPRAVQSQTPIVPEIKNAVPASVSAQGGAQPNKTVEDCACESQVLPYRLH